MSKECDGDNYVNLKDEKTGVVRGRFLNALCPCYFCFVKLFGTQYLAEFMQRYVLQRSCSSGHVPVDVLQQLPVLQRR